MRLSDILALTGGFCFWLGGKSCSVQPGIKPCFTCMSNFCMCDRTCGTVRVPINGRAVDSGELFLGSIIGDHGKIGIGVNLPTGAVVGFASNVLVTRCPAFVPSFSWLDGGGGACDLDRAVAVAMRMMQRRGQRLSAAEEEVFRAIPELATELEQPA